MSCPSWHDLVKSRHVSGGSREDAWRDALAHLDDCDRCRPEALAADPTLLFRRLPAPEVSDRDVAAMRERVAVLRRARELEAVGSRDSRRLPSSWGRVAAAVLVVGSLTAIVCEQVGQTNSSSPASVIIPDSWAAGK